MLYSPLEEGIIDISMIALTGGIILGAAYVSICIGKRIYRDITARISSLREEHIEEVAKDFFEDETVVLKAENLNLQTQIEELEKEVYTLNNHVSLLQMYTSKCRETYESIKTQISDLLGKSETESSITRTELEAIQNRLLEQEIELSSSYEELYIHFSVIELLLIVALITILLIIVKARRS